MYFKRLLDEVYCDMKIIDVEVRVISRAEGKDDNSYRDIDNFAKTESNKFCYTFPVQKTIN